MYNFNFKVKTMLNKKKIVHRKLKRIDWLGVPRAPFFKKKVEWGVKPNSADSYLDSKKRLPTLLKEPSGKGLFVAMSMCRLIGAGNCLGSEKRGLRKPDLVLSQTLNDFFFSPSFFLKVNKNSR